MLLMLPLLFALLALLGDTRNTPKKTFAHQDSVTFLRNSVVHDSRFNLAKEVEASNTSRVEIKIFEILFNLT